MITNDWQEHKTVIPNELSEIDGLESSWKSRLQVLHIYIGNLNNVLYKMSGTKRTYHSAAVRHDLSEFTLSYIHWIRLDWSKMTLIYSHWLRNDLS